MFITLLCLDGFSLFLKLIWHNCCWLKLEFVWCRTAVIWITLSRCFHCWHPTTEVELCLTNILICLHEDWSVFLLFSFPFISVNLALSYPLFLSHFCHFSLYFAFYSFLTLTFLLFLGFFSSLSYFVLFLSFFLSFLFHLDVLFSVFTSPQLLQTGFT